MSTRNSKQKNKIKNELLKVSKRCCFCKVNLNPGNITIEHVIPLSKNGSWHISNLKLSCEHCNFERLDSDFWEFHEKKKAVRDLRKQQIKQKMISE